MGVTNPKAQNSHNKRFHWVNKTPKSTHLSRSTAAEMQDIQRFVQHNFEGCRRRSQTHVTEATWKVSLRHDSRHSRGLCEAPDAGYEAFNSRLCRWRVISPKIGITRKSITMTEGRKSTTSTTSRQRKCSRRSLPDSGMHNFIKVTKAFPGLPAEISILHKPKGSAWVITRARKLGVNPMDFYDFFHLQGTLPLMALPNRYSQEYVSELWRQSAENDDIFIGIVLSHQCWKLHIDATLKTQIPQIETLRSRFLHMLDLRLLAGIIDEVLLQVITLAMDVDTYLDHKEYLAAHMTAVETIIQWLNRTEVFDSSNIEDSFAGTLDMRQDSYYWRSITSPSSSVEAGEI